MSADVLPTVLGIALVAAAAAFALIPFARPSSAHDEALAMAGLTVDNRQRVYRQLLELEFDRDLGKLSDEDFAIVSSELLSQAGASLRRERGTLVEVDAEIEREISAARAAFSAARRGAEAPAS